MYSAASLHHPEALCGSKNNLLFSIIADILCWVQYTTPETFCQENGKFLVNLSLTPVTYAPIIYLSVNNQPFRFLTFLGKGLDYRPIFPLHQIHIALHLSPHLLNLTL